MKPRDLFRSMRLSMVFLLLGGSLAQAVAQPTLNLEGESTGANVVVRAALDDPNEPKP